MQLQLKKIISSQASLKNLLNQQLPVKIAYHLSKTVKKVESEINQFVETRNSLIKKYGTEDKEGSGNYSIKEDAKEANEAFKKDVEDLLEVEVEIANYNPISIDELFNANIQISAIDLANLVGTILKDSEQVAA